MEIQILDANGQIEPYKLYFNVTYVYCFDNEISSK